MRYIVSYQREFNKRLMPHRPEVVTQFTVNKSHPATVGKNQSQLYLVVEKSLFANSCVLIKLMQFTEWIIVCDLLCKICL